MSTGTDARDLIYDIVDLEIRLGSRQQSFVVRVPKLQISVGSKVCVSGESGSGKSTLLDTLAMVRVATRSARFNFYHASKSFQVETRQNTKTTGQLDELRRDHVGYVPQTGGLVAALTVWENIVMPLRLKGERDFDRVLDITERLGVSQQLKKRPADLSVGQRQRAAIARALVAKPRIIAADEPTAALDPVNAETVMSALTQIAEDFGVAVIVVSHSPEKLLGAGFRSFVPVIEKMEKGNEILATFMEECDE